MAPLPLAHSDPAVKSYTSARKRVQAVALAVLILSTCSLVSAQGRVPSLTAGLPALSFPVPPSDNPVPAIGSFSPLSATTGGAAFTLTVNGTNFVTGAVVNFNGNARTTTFVSATQVKASILATDIATGGTFPVTVTNPAPGGGPSTPANFTVNNPLPTISSISPTNTTEGSAGFTLTVNGTGFVTGAVVNFNGSAETTTFVSATKVTASILATDIATGGIFPVTVTNPAPGGGTSSSSNFTVNNPLPTISSLSPTNAITGGAGFTLTVNGTGFVSSAVVNFNGSARTTTFVSATQVTASILASDIVKSGTFPITVTNPTPGGGKSAATNLAVNNPLPAITTLSPSSGTAGGAAFTLTVNGTGFVSGAVVNFNGSAETTTFVNGTQVTASILASDIVTGGTLPVTVTNPAPGGGASVAANFTLNNPVPTITSLSPTKTTAGGAAFSMVVSGTGFINGATVNINGSPRVTIFDGATFLVGKILATDIAAAGTLNVTVTNPAPGGGTSPAASYPVNNPVPQLSNYSPSSATTGGPAFTLTLTGLNFVAASVANFNGSPRTTTFVNGTTLTVSISDTDIATGGTLPITVINPAPGGGTAGPLNFTVNNPVPAIANISPSSGSAGGPSFTLTVNGTGFVAASVVSFNSLPRATTYVSATQLTAAILDTDIATTGTRAVTVTNPTPGGGISGTAIFSSMGGPVPTITSLGASNVTAGSTQNLLDVLVYGTNFVSPSMVNFNGNSEGTGNSPTLAQGFFTAADIASPGWDQITVTNPGLETSNAYVLTVNSGGISPIIGSPLNYVPVTPCRVVDTRNTPGAFGGPAIADGASRDFVIPNSLCGIPPTAAAYALNVAVIPAGPLGYLTLWPAGQAQPNVATVSSLDGSVKANAAIVPAGTGGAVSVFASNTTDVVMDIAGYFTADTTALVFYPVTPCRVLDTRNATAPLGGPSMAGNTSRTFPIASGACNLPVTAQAYSLNLAVVPKEPLGFLTAWPTGQAQPLAANVSSVSGTVTANAAIVPAGTSGSIDVYVSNSTDLIIDVNGYFAPPGPGGLSLYNLPPCRVLDTRQTSNGQMIQPFTGELDESLIGNTTVDGLGNLEQTSQNTDCGVPVGSQAYVVNATVVPPASFGYLTMWPQQTAQPLVATLSALDGAITSNLAIVPTNNGAISMFAANPTQLIMDLFGYFAPSSQAPTILSSSLLPTFTIGSSARTFTVIASGFPAPSLSESGALPPGVTFDPTTGVLSGTPTATGTFPITVTAQNGVLPNATQSLTVSADIGKK